MTTTLLTKGSAFRRTASSSSSSMLLSLLKGLTCLSCTIPLCVILPLRQIRWMDVYKPYQVTIVDAAPSRLSVSTQDVASASANCKSSVSIEMNAPVCREARQVWKQDPNQGRLYMRKVITEPSFLISVHSREFDLVRFTTLFEKGDYYEVLVRSRFEYIFEEFFQSTNSSHHHQRHQSKENRPIVLDVGANIGYYSLLSAAWGFPVMSWEIHPANILRLCESLEYNTLAQAIQLTRMAMTSYSQAQQSSWLRVPTHKMNPGQTSLEKSTRVKDDGVVATTSHLPNTNTTDSTSYFTVSTTTLDTYAQGQGWLGSTKMTDTSSSSSPILILKIDTEGHEPEILDGARRLLQAHLIQNVLIEFRPEGRSAMDWLLECGYVIVNDDDPKIPRLLTRQESAQFLDRESDRVRAKKNWNYADHWFRLAGLPFQ